MRKVTLVKVLNERQSLYKCEPPYCGNTYVIISICLDFVGAETYAFPSNEHGKVTDWCELDCSTKGIKDHAPVIKAIEESA